MSDRTRVLLVVEQLRRRVPGGIGSMVRGLLKGLATSNGEFETTPAVTLYASRAPRGSDPLCGRGWPVLQSALPGPLMTRAWDRRLVGVPKGFDVVHASSFAVPPTRGPRLAVTVHDLAWRQVPEAFPARGRRWHEAALHRALHHAAALVATCEPVARDLVAAGAPQDRVRVIPLGCDHLPPPDLAASQGLLDRLGVEGEFLLSVSTLEPRKNLPRLLEAYELARARLPDPWPLVMVGPQGWGERVVLGPGVVLAGQVGVATLAALYRRARLLVYVPLVEGFGLPPLEAMREGTPVVASCVPSAGDATMEVDPLDVEDIAEALVRVATDEKVRQQLVSSGRLHATAFTWARTARCYARLWDSLA
jgi:glycosyltransferase involved in cell wall biosynthesis